LVNLLFEEVEAFRRGIRVINRIGLRDIDEISRLAEGLGDVPYIERAGTAGTVFVEERVHAQPESPADPAGYFVIDVSVNKDAIRLEHHMPDHRMTAALIGGKAQDLYLAAIRRGWVSRLDHAAYLGFELCKAERALLLGTRYVQDRAHTQGSRPVAGSGK
jgi:tetrahydromethanopterin S-methyltransferase subunit A